jgi:predicted nucleic acid-binding protein
MTFSPQDCVIDASVGIKLFLQQPLSEQAHQLFAPLAIESPIRLSVPDLFFIECTNILWKYVRFSGYSVEKAKHDLIHLESLALQPFSTAELMVTALEIATSQAISAYDACYIALAQHLSVPFITADEKLIHKLSHSTYQVHWLGNLVVSTNHGPF